MTKLLMLDMQSSVPHPYASPVMVDLLDQIHLNSGYVVADRWEPISVTVIDDPEAVSGLTDWMLTVPFLIASWRFADILRSLNSDCEYLPLVVRYHNQTLEGEYFALNALHVVHEAIDLEQSKIGYYDAEFHFAEDIEKLVLKPESLGNAPLCYLSEISHYAVSDELATAIAAAGLVGIELMEPTKFSSG